MQKDTDPMTKTCSKCGLAKAHTEFAKCSRARDGLQHHCRACNRAYRQANKARLVAYQAERYAADPERARARAREWHGANKDRARDARLRRVYGISAAEYAEMLSDQGGGCAICRADFGPEGLDVDHCHVTGAVRGLLCGPCNRGIGFLADDPARLAAAIKYLRPTGAMTREDSYDCGGLRAS